MGQGQMSKVIHEHFLLVVNTRTKYEKKGT